MRRNSMMAGASRKKRSLRDRELGLLTLTQPEVIFDSPVQITKSMEDLTEALGTSIIRFRGVRFRGFDRFQAMAGVENYNILERGVHS